MSLIDNKAGSGAVDPFDHNALVDAVVALQASSGGSQPGASRWIGPCKINCFTSQYLYTTGGDVTGGTFTLTVNGETTSALAWNAALAVVTAALAALPSIGPDNVTVTLVGSAASLNDGYLVSFEDALATTIIEIGTGSLTGPSSPYSDVTEASGVLVDEMFTPAAGDIVIDFLHAIKTEWAEGTPTLNYQDNPDGGVGTPNWATPDGSAGGQIDLTTGADGAYTNFTGGGTSNPGSTPTAHQAEQTKWDFSETQTFYSTLPAVALNAVPIYAVVDGQDSNPTAGEVWIWVNVATPVAE